jgi:hypothetical protein
MHALTAENQDIKSLSAQNHNNKEEKAEEIVNIRENLDQDLQAQDQDPQEVIINL